MAVPLAFVTSSLTATIASADFTGFSFQNATAIVDAIPNQSIPAGHFVWRLYANFNDPLDAFLNVTVDLLFDQPLYQNPFGGDGPPNPLLFDIPGFEFLAADTFVTHGVSQQPIDALGFDPDFEMLPNGIAGGWFDSHTQTPTYPVGGLILIWQVTLPSNAKSCFGFGTIYYEDAQNPGTATPGSELICWPSPGTLPLLALAVLGASRRRSGLSDS